MSMHKGGEEIGREGKALDQSPEDDPGHRKEIGPYMCANSIKETPP
jgi:hypothetical protein